MDRRKLDDPVRLDSLIEQYLDGLYERFGPGIKDAPPENPGDEGEEEQLPPGFWEDEDDLPDHR